MVGSPKISACPFCASKRNSVQHVGPWVYVTCHDCHADGPRAQSAADAITLWNRRPKGADGHGEAH